MVVHPAPTGPQEQLRTRADKTDWNRTLVQPTRVPWGRILLLTFFLSVLIGSGVLFAWAWAQRAFPNFVLLHWLPNVATTTVVERQVQNTSTTPTAVLQTAESLASLVVTQPAGATYSPDDVIGPAIPLSSGGWFVARQETIGTSALSLVPQIGDPQDMTQTLPDPASGFVFLKTSATALQPITMADQAPVTGQSVWLAWPALRQMAVERRQLVLGHGPTWHSSDVQDRWWQLDQGTSAPVGAAVVDQRGHLVGLMGPDQKLWLASAINSTLKQVIQEGLAERPSLGLTYLMQNEVAVNGQATATGALIGAADPAQAIVAGGAAEKAGLRAGDIIATIDQNQFDDLFAALRRYRPGQTITIGYRRDNALRQATVELVTLRP